MSEPVRYEVQGAVAVITIDNPPVNTLGVAVRHGIAQALERAAVDGAVAAVVLTGAGRGFSGGADIHKFDRPPDPQAPSLREVIYRLEDSPKPVTAALHGAAVGGGLELALGCRGRMGAPSARLGLPEVKLGLIPGAGGTQRLPRLIGVEAALDLILAGEPMAAEAALAAGLLDAVTDGDLIAAAIAFAEAPIAEGRPRPKTRERTVPDVDASLFAKRRRKIERRARGLIAPWACIDAVENATRLPFDAAMKAERDLFRRCRDSEQSRAQRHVFFAERQAGKVPGLAPDTATLTIERAAVIGCGTMGRGIAISFADAHIPVRVVEASAEALEKGLAAIRKTIRAAAAKGRLSVTEAEARMACVTGGTDLAAEAADADIVIEAVFEDLEVKRQILGALDRVCKPEAILATNTSTLDIDRIAAATERPDKVIGTHFFSPAHVMKLVEAVRGEKTSDETIATVMALSRRLGKVGVLVGVCDGFVGNRMYHAYSRQAQLLLEEGALPQQVDRVLYDFGFAMGPFAVGDLAGLDIGWQIRRRRAATRPKTESGPESGAERYSPIADRICEKGRFGQKTGAGWYRYETGSRTPVADPEIEALIAEVSAEQGIERRAVAADEILERCLYVMVNEGAKILEEGLAQRPGDIDVIWIYGYGFPVHRGGPLFYADTVGLKAVTEALVRLHALHGDAFKPAALLMDLAGNGKKLSDLSSNP